MNSDEKPKHNQIKSPRIIFHLGFQKCGSTFLQDKVFPSLNDESDVIYDPAPAARLIHNVLGCSVLDSWEQAESDAIQDALAKLAATTIVFSNENWCGSPMHGYPDFERRIDFLNAVCPGSTVVLVVRSQAGFIESLYRQQVKLALKPGARAKWLKPFDLFFNGFQPLDSPPGIGVPIHEVTRADPFSFHFGEFARGAAAQLGGQLFVYALENLRSDPVSFVVRMSKDLELPRLEINEGSEAVNPAIAAGTCRLAVSLNRNTGLERFLYPRTFLSRIVSKTVHTLGAMHPDQSRFVDGRLAQMIKTHYAGSNRLLGAHLDEEVLAAHYGAD